MRRAIVDGFRYVRREPGLRIAALAMCLNTFLAAPFIALVPTMAQEVLNSGTSGTAILVTAQGIGAVLMAFSLGSLVGRYTARRVLVTLMATLPFALVAVRVRARARALRARALRGRPAVPGRAVELHDDRAAARAGRRFAAACSSVFTVILGSLYPLGAIVQGKIADYVGLRWTTFGSAVLMLVVLGVARVVRPGVTEAIDAPSALGSPA